MEYSLEKDRSFYNKSIKIKIWQVRFFSYTSESKKIKTKYRVISPILFRECSNLNRVYETESHSMHGQLPIIWDRAEGFQVYDSWGNKWLDFQVQYLLLMQVTQIKEF